MSLFSAFGEGNGNPFQYFSFLENPMDRGAWQATVHGGHECRTDWLSLTLSALPSGCNFHSFPSKAFPKHFSLLPPCSYLPSLLAHSLPLACCPSAQMLQFLSSEVPVPQVPDCHIPPSVPFSVEFAPPCLPQPFQIVVLHLYFLFLKLFVFINV